MFTPLPLGELTLPDGRVLAYAEYGRPNGLPVFFFHGTPGSRLFARLLHNAAADRGVRIIAPERPGYGRSTPHPGRTLMSWPGDVAALATHLGLERFAIAGISGGGPYALACAAAMPARVSAVAVVSGVAPFRKGVARRMGWRARSGFWLARHVSPLVRLQFRFFAWSGCRRPDQLLRQFRRQASPPDRAILAREEIGPLVVEDFCEALRQGGRAPAEDMRLFSSPWEVPFAAISAPVQLYQGTADRIVPPVMARLLAKLVPGANLAWWEGGGHFAGVDHSGEILDALTAAAR